MIIHIYNSGTISFSTLNKCPLKNSVIIINDNPKFLNTIQEYNIVKNNKYKTEVYNDKSGLFFILYCSSKINIRNIKLDGDTIWF